MGVKEIDMVMNYGAAKGGDWAAVRTEIDAVVEEAHARGVLVKVIFETCEMDEACIRAGVDACVDAGADFVKTSTASPPRARPRRLCGPWFRRRRGAFASRRPAGIRTINDARGYVEMGAERLGVGFSTTPALVAADEESK